MLDKVFKAYDVRATVPDPLNADVARRIGFGTGRLLLEESEAAGRTGDGARRIVVGHDMRPHSPELVAALKAGLRAAGADVVDVGLVDTPFIYFAVNHLDAAGGVQTTASHNPIQYNGFKISRVEAKPVGKGSGLEIIQQYAEQSDGHGDGNGGETSEDLWAAYTDHVHRFLHPDLLSGKQHLKVVVDASNGMAGTFMPKVFGDVPGLEVVPINFENDKGVFVHEPNPLVEANLRQVRDGVVAEGAAVGICFDGDADRCMVVDELGTPVGCDLLTAWLAAGFLAQDPGGSIVYDLRSSHSVPEMIMEHGGEPHRSRVGHVFMKGKARETNAIFGGELSGHFYFRDNFFADSGAMAFAAVISNLLDFDGTMSEAIAPTRRYLQSGEINFETPDKDAAMASLVAAYPDAKTDTLDGVTVDLGEWWCNVRASNTEPLLRLNLEGPDADTVAEKVTDVSALLGERVEE
ncbi:MAG: phosphomannomutase/phosphoglucomutase [Phycisphaerales bacterium]|nr:phosphomannomutase/phosphoglucomutase [Phycisphaerales bacterium]